MISPLSQVYNPYTFDGDKNARRQYISHPAEQRQKDSPNSPSTGMVSRLGEDEKRQLHVFRPRPSWRSIQQREFKSLPLPLENLQWVRTGGCLIRFWTPSPTTSKRKRLSISEQPFCNGVCRCRYHCIQYANGIKDVGEAEAISCRSCTGYLALPIFEQQNGRERQKRGSVGVLEILTFTKNIRLDATFLEKLKGVSLEIRCPPPCRKPEGCRGRSDKRVVGLHALKDLYNLPLIQKWLDGHACFVEYGRSWVGRAHSQKQICLAEDVRGCGILDYSLAPLARLSSFTAFRLTHPNLPLVFENSYSRADLLKHPLCTLVQQLQKYIVESGLTDDEEFLVQFSHRDFDNVLHSNVCRSVGRTGCQELGNGKEDHEVATVQEDDVQHCNIKNGQLGEASKSGKRLEGDQVHSHELGNGKEDHEVATVQDDNVQHYNIENGQLVEASKSEKRLRGDQVQSHELGNGKEDNVQHCGMKNGAMKLPKLKGDQVQSHETSGSHGEKQWLSLSAQQPDSEITAGKKNPSPVQQPSSETTDDKKNPQGTTESSGEPGQNISKRKKITLDIIQSFFGRRLIDVAEELKVSKSTLKRHCRNYNIKSWPSNKRKKANPVPLNKLGDRGGKEQECDSRPSLDHDSGDKQVTDANGPGGDNHSLIVKARYNEYLVKFPFSTCSGIKALRQSVAMRFQLEVERITIEYDDEDGDRVMLSCDEDLGYHMHTLSTSGRTRMDLHVSR